MALDLQQKGAHHETEVENDSWRHRRGSGSRSGNGRRACRRRLGRVIERRISRAPWGRRSRRRPGRGRGLTSGLTESELRAQLEAGKSLAQIASAQGKSVAGARGRHRLRREDAPRRGGHEREADRCPGRDDARRAEVARRRHGQRHRRAPRTGRANRHRARVRRRRGDLPRADTGRAADAARGRQDPRPGRAAGVGGRLEAAILAGAKQDLDQAVAAGKLTAAQEQEMLSRLQEHVDDIVNNAGPVSVNKTAPASVTA